MTTLIFGSTTNSTRQDVALLIGRVALGVVLIAHGWQKFFSYGISGVAANFDTMGVPLPAASATFAAVVELVGGILLIIGLDMAGALLFVHAPNGVFVDGGGYELVLVIGALAVVFAGLGAGAYAIDRLIPTRSRRSAVAA